MNGNMEFNPSKCQLIHVTRSRSLRPTSYTLHGQCLKWYHVPDTWVSIYQATSHGSPIRTVWSEYFLSIFWIANDANFFGRTTKTLIKLRECAGWFESLLDAHARRYVFTRCGSYMGCLVIGIYIKYYFFHMSNKKKTNVTFVRIQVLSRNHFALPPGVIGTRLGSVMVAIPGHLLHYFVFEK